MSVAVRAADGEERDVFFFAIASTGRALEAGFRLYHMFLRSSSACHRLLTSRASSTARFVTYVTKTSDCLRETLLSVTYVTPVALYISGPPPIVAAKIQH